MYTEQILSAGEGEQAWGSGSWRQECRKLKLNLDGRYIDGWAIERDI
jgi:hypothetical protein